VCCQRYVEAEVLRLLLGDEDDIVEAIRRIDQSRVDGVRAPVCGTIRRHFPGLSSEQLADCWGNALVCLVKLARDDELTEDSDLAKLLYVIMQRRAIDALRILQRRPTSIEISVGDGLERIPCPRCRRGDPVVLEELLIVTVEAAKQLVNRQRQAWLAYIRLGLDANQTELAIELSVMTGIRWTGKNAKKALDDGRPKIQEYLRRRGYGSEFPKDD
jgi:DNA-directed RNA polymerase specialized sigma24 family protein